MAVDVDALDDLVFFFVAFPGRADDRYGISCGPESRSLAPDSTVEGGWEVFDDEENATPLTKCPAACRLGT